MKRKNRPLPDRPQSYPAGVFVHTERGYYYISAPDKRLLILNKRVLESWSPQRVIETTEAAVANYRVAAKLKFRNGSLIDNFSDGKIYLVSGGKRRHIVNPDVLDRLGARYQDVVRVSLDEINLHEEGEPIV